jgi:putative cell wall-binding protein
MLHFRKLWPALLVLCLLLNLAMPVGAAQKENSGAIIPLATPIPVYTAEDLSNVRNNLSGHYIQMADIDLGTAPWNAGDGWLPIGDGDTSFSGVFDGNGYSITNLTIQRPGGMYVGLFGLTDTAAPESLKNIRLIDAFVTGSFIVGGLVGHSGGPVYNCSVSGSITGDDGYTGGMIGLAQNIVSHCEADVTVQGKMYAGGIAGTSNAGVFYSSSKGSIHSTDYGGGICGYSVADVLHCHSSASVTGQRYVGGLLGVFSGMDTTVNFCSASGPIVSVPGSGTQSAAGGLIGWTDGVIRNSQATGTVTGIDEVGGLVGYGWESEIRNSWATGSVIGRSSVGGLVGAAYGLVQASRAAGSVTGYTNVGGLVGKCETGSQVVMCQAFGPVTGYAYLGGLVGDADGPITCSSASGNIVGQETDGQMDYNYIGGLAGVIRPECIISSSYALGATSGNLSLGGLVGMSLGGSVRDSYAQGAVTGNDNLGGLVGFAHFGSVGGNDISRCFATGHVQSAPSSAYAGGLIGRLYSEVALVSSYYDSTTSSQEDTGKGEPRTTSQLITGTPSEQIYSEWSTETWCFSPDTEYPWLHCNRPARIPVARLAGANRYSTATVISQTGWPACRGRADTVVIATGSNFPDSLSGVSLAYALDAPVLLTTKDSLPAATRSEIERLGAQRVIILGGTGAISLTVESDLQTIPGVMDVDRIAGDNRYDTAKQIALQPELDYDTIFLASGLAFPDALSAAAYAAQRGQPILLNGKTILNNSVKTLLQSKPEIRHVIVVGGPSAIADSVITELTALDLTVERVYGSNRYQTSQALANMLWSTVGKSVFIATGANFPDALAGGVLAASQHSGVLLVQPTALTVPTTISTFIENRSIVTAAILGGTTAVTSGMESDLNSILQE